MKIKYRTRAAGPKGIIKVGDIAEVPEAEARLLVDGGYAEALEPFAAKEAPEEKPAPKVKVTRK